MKLIRHLISGILVSFLLVSGANAVLIEPKQGTNAYQFNTYALSFGIDDDTGIINLKGAQTAAAIAQQIGTYYGNSAWGLGKSGPDGNMNMQSSFIGANILNFDSLIPDTFTNVDNFIFYLNGHGLKVDSDTPNEIFTASNGVDTNYGITDIELKSYLSYLPDSLNKIVILDSCYSGGFIDELKSLKYISIITSSSATSKSAYDFNGVPYFSRELYNFFVQQKGRGFELDDMVRYLRYNYNFNKYKGMAYELGAGDPITLSEEYFNIQTYQSPEYAPVPEPSTLILSFGGLLSLFFFRRKF